MSGRSSMTKEARRIERLYGTKAHGTKHGTVMRLLHNVGLEGCIQQLEAWGLKPNDTGDSNPEADDCGDD